MRAATVQALRDYFADGDDPTTAPMLLEAAGIPYRDPERIIRLLLRALREQQQDINALTARVAAIEAKVP
jgi:hypothetical protein